MQKLVNETLYLRKILPKELSCDSWETISKETTSTKDEPSVANMSVNVSQLPIIEKDGKKVRPSIPI